MYSYEESDDRIPILQMNSELQHAQMELLSAHCATYQLRLHYSADDLARFGRRDVLRKSAEAASALNDFYSSITKKIAPASAPSQPLKNGQMATAIDCVSMYLRQQRDHYHHQGEPLSDHYKARMWPYFSAELLDQIRIVELRGERVPTPSFYAEARAQGFENLPEVTHMESLTFIDVVVFNEAISERALFHALVHAVQFLVMGVDDYTERFVKSFLRTRAHFTVPLEAHAFALTSKFMQPEPQPFSVDEHVTRWLDDNRY